MQTRSSHILGIAALALSGALLAIWGSPVLVTTDGPSHVYNAIVGQAVRAGEAPFAEQFHLEGQGASNRAADITLHSLGAMTDWDTAERLLMSLAVVGQFFSLMFLGGWAKHHALLLAPLVAWLTNSWFLWMGFYDFSLSIPLLVLLALVVDQPGGWRRQVALQGMLALLFFTHLFTFTIGAGLSGSVAAWEVLHRRRAPRALLESLPALGALLVQLHSGAAGRGVVAWSGALKALAGLGLGDFLVSFFPLDVASGALVMLVVWATLWRVARRSARDGAVLLSGRVVFAAALLIFSPFLPDAVGDGSYIHARLRFFAVILLLPEMGERLASLPRRVAWVASFAVLAGLWVHSAAVTRLSKRVAADEHDIQTALLASGAGSGRWVKTILRDRERGLFRISAYQHLTDRISGRLGLLSLDDYESYLAIFPVKWNRVPDDLEARSENGGWSVRLLPRQECWRGSLLVVHEADRPVRVSDPLLEMGPTQARGAFAVTPVSVIERTPRCGPRGGPPASQPGP